MRVFSYRPEHRNVDPEDNIDWDDNPLSNFLAWYSDTVLGDVCASWIGRTTEYIWTDCGCCLALRGLFLGSISGGLLGLVTGYVIFG